MIQNIPLHSTENLPTILGLHSLNPTLEALDPVRSHKDIDYPVAIEVPSGLEVGTYEVIVKVVEDGDPWENERTITMTLVVEELVVEESTE